jgi:hypothetical protein
MKFDFKLKYWIETHLDPFSWELFHRDDKNNTLNMGRDHEGLRQQIERFLLLWQLSFEIEKH